MEVVFSPEAEDELSALPPGERVALLAAFERLEALGDKLPFPHSSAVKGTSVKLRELRPRGGRSPWRRSIAGPATYSCLPPSAPKPRSILLDFGVLSLPLNDDWRRLRCEMENGHHDQHPPTPRQ